MRFVRAVVLVVADSGHPEIFYNKGIVKQKPERREEFSYYFS